MEQQGQGQQRPKIEWKRDKAFTDPRSGVTVAVSKSSGHVPMYSFQIGRMREDGSVSTNSQWRTRRNQATFELENDYASLIASLLTQAQEYAVTQMQWDWAQNLDRQVERETRRGGDDSKPKGLFVRAPGKTARDKARKGGAKA